MIVNFFKLPDAIERSETDRREGERSEEDNRTTEFSRSENEGSEVRRRSYEALLRKAEVNPLSSSSGV